jgi:hypothetical protein
VSKNHLGLLLGRRCLIRPHPWPEFAHGDVDHSEEILGQASRILIAPDQRLTDDLVPIRAGEMPQKSLASHFENERGERTALRTSPSVQLDRKMAVVNDALKRWRVPEVLPRQIQRYTVSAIRETSLLVYCKNFHQIRPNWYAELYGIKKVA